MSYRYYLLSHFPYPKFLYIVKLEILLNNSQIKGEIIMKIRNIKNKASLKMLHRKKPDDFFKFTGKIALLNFK